MKWVEGVTNKVVWFCAFSSVNWVCLSGLPCRGDQGVVSWLCSFLFSFKAFLSLSLKRPAPLFVILACYLPIFCMQQFSIVSRDCLYVQDFSLVFVFCMNSTFRLNC